MTTRQKHDWRCRGEHIATANGTIRFQASLHALVIFESYGHTSIAFITMEVVNPDAFTYSTNIAFVTMVDILSWSVVEELAFRAVVFCKGVSTSSAQV